MKSFALLMVLSAFANSVLPSVTAAEAASKLQGIKNINHNLVTSPETNPKEIGLVHWKRSIEDALNASKQQQKPVFLLFQEVPGCQGCVNFGNTPLNHPLLVEAIESLFIPVFIYNNKDGYDKQVLEAFGEPAWNYPVLRFLDQRGRDIIEKHPAKVHTSTHYLASRMIAALKAAGKEVPEYLDLVRWENAVDKHEKSTFQMACYYHGEAVFGAVEGVVSTFSRIARAPRFMEVVDVTYLPDLISYEELVRHAMKQKCANRIYVHDEQQRAVATKLGAPNIASISEAEHAVAASSEEQKNYLNGTRLSLLPVTVIQATKINSLLASGRGYISEQEMEKAPQQYIEEVKILNDESRKIDKLIMKILSPNQIRIMNQLKAVDDQDLQQIEPLRKEHYTVKELNEYISRLESALTEVTYPEE